MTVSSFAAIAQFAPVRFESPLLHASGDDAEGSLFITDADRIRFDISLNEAGPQPASFEPAGARRLLFYDPPQTRAAIVTCGGLCPGLNDVIRALVMELHHWYGVREVLGIQYGYAGLVPDTDCPPRPLTVADVDDIHTHGGTILGSSRGKQGVGRMVDMLVERRIDMLFCIGGDGTLRGAHELAREIRRRGLPIAIVGIPKTIDNDIDLIYRSFGFQTAVEEADKVLDCAHMEANGARNGIGLVKLMGRESGFIAAHATLASGDVNYCLVPEVPFDLGGDNGLLAHLRRRLATRRHAVIVVAEGAGANLIGDTGRRDASGNVIVNDIGLYLKEAITSAFAEWNEPVSIKYFDPSYLIRSVRANSSDSIFCGDLGRHAVHAAMAGKTDLLIGLWHGVFTHVPLEAIVGRRKKINPNGNLWHSVLASTGQPSSMSNIDAATTPTQD
ncbi:MAG: ATP-dependent 6-phosphofructokinase [bacterium]|nr:ATP-dependent 6-phosphofructokinase [bacterium]